MEHARRNADALETPKRAKLLPVLLAEPRCYERRWTRDRKTERFEGEESGDGSKTKWRACA